MTTTKISLESICKPKSNVTTKGRHSLRPLFALSFESSSSTSVFSSSLLKAHHQLVFHIVAAQEYYLKSGRQQILYDKAMPNAPTCLVASNLPVGHICPAQLDCMPAGAIYTAVPHAPEISTSLSFFHRVLLTQNLISLGASSGLTRYSMV